MSQVQRWVSGGPLFERVGQHAGQLYREDYLRPDIQRIIKATHLCHAERYDALPVDMGVGPAFVSVTLLDGTEYHTERIYPVGHRTDPISDQALEENSCAVPARYWVRSSACVMQDPLEAEG